MSGVKAGDLAIIKCREPSYNGRIVEVLSTAPSGSFELPDGRRGTTKGYSGLHWIVKFIGGQAFCRFADGKKRLSSYGIAPDWSLYPHPGDPESIDERQPDEVSA